MVESDCSAIAVRIRSIKQKFRFASLLKFVPQSRMHPTGCTLGAGRMSRLVSVPGSNCRLEESTRKGAEIVKLAKPIPR
jgi:hypothetical protein